MYNMEIHKLLNNGSKIDKNYHFLIEEIMQKLDMSSEISFNFFKISHKGAKPENDLKITLKVLFVAFERKVEL